MRTDFQCIHARGHSKSTLTNFCPILTTYLPIVDIGWHLYDYLPNVNFVILDATTPKIYLHYFCRQVIRRDLLQTIKFIQF